MKNRLTDKDSIFYKMGWKYRIAFALVFWVAITQTIQAFKCPSMTKTQLFLSTPKSFILKFENC